MNESLRSLITQRLEATIQDVEQVAREIYYAMSFLEYSHPARANLNQALQLIGVRTPEDVGLSNQVLVSRVINDC